MNIIKLLKASKAVTGFVASASTGVVIDNVVKATTPAELTKFQKYMVRAGGFFVSFTVSGLIADRVEAGFDKLIKAIESGTDPDIYAQGVSKKFDDFLATLTPEEQKKLALELVESAKAAQKEDPTEKEED